jgi:hypothetical protein
MFLVAIWWFSSLFSYEMPALVRPMGLAEGNVSLNAGAPEAIRIGAVVSEAAASAAQDEGGVVFFELDLSGTEVQPEVEVIRTDVRQMLLPRESLPPGADARWTIACEPDEPCEAAFEVTFSHDAADNVLVGWRLTAEVRPHRATEVSSGATIELTVDGDSG